LNYCISKRLHQEQLKQQESKVASSSLAYSDDTEEAQQEAEPSDSNGWEAFEDEALDIPSSSDSTDTKSSSVEPRKRHVPEGREGALYELEGKVLAMTGEPMFLPKTQVCVCVYHLMHLVGSIECD
jgi:hypothetical protein